MTSEFVHLHNHSDYSLLDGAQRVEQLVNTIDDLKSSTSASDQASKVILSYLT